MIFQEEYKQEDIHEDTPSVYTPPTWAGGTDAEIVEAIEKHYSGDIDLTEYWSVGDEREISLSAMEAAGVGESHVAQTATIVIVNIGGKTLETAVNEHTECAFIWQLKDCLIEKGYVNRASTNSGGWNGCNRRIWCNNVFYAALPTYLQNITKEVANLTTAGGGSSSIITSYDYIGLPSVMELGKGNYAYASTGEGSIWSYYNNSSNRIKTLRNGSSGVEWWTRSTHITGNPGWNYVGTDGSFTNMDPTSQYGIAPFGCI